MSDQTHTKGAFLEGAHLEGAIFVRARLDGASLVTAHLEGAILEEAHLEGAFLNGANLKGARVSGANFEEAVLGWEQFPELEGKLKGIMRERANLEDVDLRSTFGLTANQLHAADGNARTRPPEGLPRPAQWPPFRATS